MGNANYVIWFDQLRMSDVGSVGGKNASLGEMISQLSHTGVRVPGGFATTADAYRDFLAHEGLAARIEKTLATLDIEDVEALARTGAQIRGWIVAAPLPARLEKGNRHGLRKNAERSRRRRYFGSSAFLSHRRGPSRRLIRWAAGNFS